MSETQLDTMEEMYHVGKIVIAVMVISLISSAFVHELGHALAFELLGIPTKYIFEIRAVGPIIGVRVPYMPSTLIERFFVIGAGGGFAAIVFALLGRLWRIECYMVAVAQAFYAIFEIVTWMTGLQAAQDLTIFCYFFAIVPIPTVLAANYIANRIVRAKYFS